jgi:hypothetical protein
VLRPVRHLPLPKADRFGTTAFHPLSMPLRAVALANAEAAWEQAVAAEKVEAEQWVTH